MATNPLQNTVPGDILQGGITADQALSFASSTPIKPAPPLDPLKILQQGYQQTSSILSNAGLIGTPTTPQTSVQAPISPAPISVPAPEQPAEVQPQPVLTAKDFGIPELPTAEQVIGRIPQFSLEDILKTPGVQLGQLATELEKQSIEREGRIQKTAIQEEFGKRGLFMSGAREGAELDLQEKVLAANLGVDVKFAGLLLNAFEEAQKESAKQVADLISDAKKGRQEAIDQVNKLGYAVLPNGAVVPTAAEQRAAGAEERAEQAAGRAEIQLQLSMDAAKRAEQTLVRPQIASYEYTDSAGNKYRRIETIDRDTGEITSTRTELLTSGGGGALNLTNSQVNTGAAVADVSIADFRKMSSEAQNFFINRRTEVENRKADIQTILLTGINPSDVEAYVNALGYPKEVVNSLVKYLNQQTPIAEASLEEPTPFSKLFGTTRGFKEKQPTKEKAIGASVKALK